MGTFPLTSVESLARVTIAFPGEVWTDAVASGAILPGEAVVPAGRNANGEPSYRVAVAADNKDLVAVAMRPVEVPAQTLPQSPLEGPNEAVNKVIASGEYVRRVHSGVIHTTLVVPDTYEEGDLVGWDANGARPTFLDGSGAWSKDAAADIDSLFVVTSPGQRYADENDQGLVTLRFIGRGNN